MTRASVLLRVALLGLPLAAAVACAESSSSPTETTSTEPEAGTSTADASTADTSPSLPEKATTTTLLDLSPLQPKVGQEVTLKATVSGKTPTGTVQLKDGATNLGAPIALVPGVDPTTASATFKSTTLAAGAHAVTAVYSGDDDDATSTSTTTSFALTYATTLPFDTGVDNARAPLANVAVDPHWTIKNGAAKVFAAYVQTDAKGFPGIWLAPSATSKFLSPFIDTDDTAAEGPFTYTTTFTLRTGVNLAATTLTVRYASDNAVDGITLNAQPVAGVTAGSYGSFTTLVIPAPFVEGPNTISFVSSNTGGPTGFRAELDLTAN